MAILEEVSFITATPVDPKERNKSGEFGFSEELSVV